MNACINEKDYKFKYQEVPEKGHEPQDTLLLPTGSLHPSHHMKSLTLQSSQFTDRVSGIIVPIPAVQQRP